MPYFCPEDGTELVSRGKRLHCPHCEHDYRLRALCVDCGSELERLVACGAADWFCNRCNTLKSKASVHATPERVD